MGDEATYTFKEVFDRFERDVQKSFEGVNRRLDAIEAKTDANTADLAVIRGRLLYLGGIGAIAGAVIAGLLVKYLGK